MPSGFQQDLNQLQPVMYRVVVTMGGGTATWPTADGNNNGGVTPNSSDSFSTANLPTTLVKAKARARGNMRFRNIVNRLTGLADCQIHDITITEANADAQATSLSFTVKYERDSGLIAACGATTFTPTTGGAVTIDSNAKALRFAVANGIADATTASMRVYDPVNIVDTQTTITVAAPDTLADIYDDVTVTLIDESTLLD